MKKLMPKVTKKRVIVFFVVIAVVGVGLWLGYFRKKNGMEKGQVMKGDVVEELVLSGEIKALEHAEMGFETSGKIVYVGVKEGERVKRGRLLSKLDTTSLNAAYQQALANLRKYEATVDNVHDQVKDHSGDETYAQKDLRTTAEATKDSAYEAVVAAERALKGASLYAPFDGVVAYVANPFSGVFVTYAQKQFEVVNPETIYFEVAADQTDVTEINLGDRVDVILDSYPDKTVRGVADEISFAPDETEVGVVYKVRVGLIEGIGEYRLGMTGDAVFRLKEVKDVLYVETKFINSDKEGKYLLVNEGKKKVYIVTGVEGDETTEVEGELKEGDTIYD